MRKVLFALVLLLLIGGTAFTLFNAEFSKIRTRPDQIMQTQTDTTSFFDFTVNSLDGKPVALSQYKGKKIIILNVASACGYTPQYADWQKFYDANQDKVVVLGFPCNDFGAQEPGSPQEIGAFCQKNYGVTFPMFEKVTVKGTDKSPLYQWLTDSALNGWNTQEPSWNFCKYLIDENGKLVSFFASKVKPDNAEFLTALGM